MARAKPLDRILLVGNPNVGKSVLFKNLTGRYVTVSNYPGTTVEVVRARARLAGQQIEVVDTPGINDLAAATDETQVTAAMLERHPEDIVVQVADARNLRRALLLTMQLSELRRPMMLVLNMVDELAAKGGRIDTEALAERLGIPVVRTIAVRNHGTENLATALPRAGIPTLDDVEAPSGAGEYERNRLRLARINELMETTYSLRQPARASLGVRLGFWAMHPVKGLLLAALALLGVFWFVGLFGAGTLVDLLEVGVFEQRLSPAAIETADRLLPFPHAHEVGAVPGSLALPLSPVHEIELFAWQTESLRTGYQLTPGAELSAGRATLRFAHDFLVGEYGAVTMALSYSLAIVLPIVTTFFLLFSLLEDSGYLPRMAILVNRVFRLMGLNGKAVLPMVLGLGCDTMATMTTRILETRKERIVTTMLLALAIPCSAQLGVLLAMMAALSPAAALAWLALMAAVLLTVGRLTARVFPGEASDFLLEIPPLRRPQLGNVWLKTRSRIRWYLREVIPLFVVGTAVLFLLDKLRLLGRIATLGEPLVVGWLGLPREMANALLVGFLRRDFGAVYVLDAATGPEALLEPLEIFVAMVTITLFMPCFANFLMIAKEHGQRVAWTMTAFIFPFAFLVGGLALRIGRWMSAF
ncbi:MAG: FeoB small GTPase domain-containing protein [Thermoanaerobaculia bacterium]